MYYSSQSMPDVITMEKEQFHPQEERSQLLSSRELRESSSFISKTTFFPPIARFHRRLFVRYFLVCQQTNGFETAHPCLIGSSSEILAQSNPMMRFLRAVSTTSLVTTVSWLATSTRSTCIMRRSIKRMFPWVIRMMAATAS